MVRFRSESAYKPGSVEDNYSSATCVTTGCQAAYPNPLRAAKKDSYLALLRVGFTLPQTVTRCAVRSYRTFSPLPNQLRKVVMLGGIFSAALAVNSHFPGVTWHSALRSPDFPPFATSIAVKRLAKKTNSNCPADSPQD
jgi:hypothetical protein